LGGKEFFTLKSQQQLPAEFKLAYSASQVAKRVRLMGDEISPWVSAAEAVTGQQVLCICVLRGGVLFFTDLIRAIPSSVEMTFCRTWSYSSANNERSMDRVRVSVDDVVAQGRAILLIDDICDTGSTLQKLQRVFLDLGAQEVKTAVLIHRVVENSLFTPDYRGFDYQGDDWFVGYGMEDKNHYSNLSEIYILPKVE